MENDLLDVQIKFVLKRKFNMHQKSLDLWTYKQDFKLNLLLLRERDLICRPEPRKPKHRHKALRKNKRKPNTTQKRHFSVPIQRERESRFLALLLNDIYPISDDLRNIF